MPQKTSKQDIARTVDYLSSIEEIKGDYFEFGVFNGSSFSHAVRCAKNSEKYDPDFKKMIFFGFDSFAGFGEVDNFDKHKFYTDINFKTDYEKVLNRIRKIIPNDRFRLIKGFFKDSLKLELKTKRDHDRHHNNPKIN